MSPNRWKQQKMFLKQVVWTLLWLVSSSSAFTSFNSPNRRLKWVIKNLAATIENDNPAVNGDSATTKIQETVSVETNGISNDKEKDDEEILEGTMNVFDLVCGRAASCLLESDMRRDAKGEHGTNGKMPSSATNWINDAAAFALKKSFEKVKLKLAEERTGLDRDEASSWIRWMKSAPTPLVVDLSAELRLIANSTISDKNFELIEQTRLTFLSRLGCRLILLPSGSTLTEPLIEPPASLIYGKLLYGGVTRYRRLASSNSNRPPRNAGERTDVKVSANDNIPPWLQYGGPERMYRAVDMGAAAVLEIVLLPRGQSLPNLMSSSGDMVVANVVWKPQQMFDYVREKTDEPGVDEIDFVSGYTPISLSGKERNIAFESDFRSSVGGLKKEIDAIVRRVLDGRVLRPAQEDDNAVDDETTTELSMAAMEAEELEVLGLTPVRGLLLYGPPGNGKTVLAREISRALRARAPKIVSAPELLDRWVGGSEKLVRGLFAEAEAELDSCNGDSTKSALHVIVIDEIDAVFRRRSAGEDSGEATRASVVNQILSKLDGIKSIGNVLLIGMTNRRELLDEALLRPGRLEVQIEIPLPDREGRREILEIHFEALRKKGRLSKPLCCAIDGVASGYSSDKPTIGKEEEKLQSGRKRRAIKRAVTQVLSEASSVVRPSYDLAANYATAGFSGADIAGLVRCAGSLALSRARKDGNGVKGLLITLEDAKQALIEIKK
jgi:vesicle-fusing ATPase